MAPKADNPCRLGLVVEGRWKDLEHCTSHFGRWSRRTSTLATGHGPKCDVAIRGGGREDKLSTQLERQARQQSARNQ